MDVLHAAPGDASRSRAGRRVGARQPHRGRPQRRRRTRGRTPARSSPTASTAWPSAPGAPPARSSPRRTGRPRSSTTGARWRMYLTEIDGVPERWDGHERRIVEYVSGRPRRTGAPRPAPARQRPRDRRGGRALPRRRWRLWYKDEAAGSVTTVAVVARPRVVARRGHRDRRAAARGPSVFALGGWWWMITDEWRGMAVHRSRTRSSGRAGRAGCRDPRRERAAGPRHPDRAPRRRRRHRRRRAAVLLHPPVVGRRRARHDGEDAASRRRARCMSRGCACATTRCICER